MVNFASLILSLIYIGILALIGAEFPPMLLSVLLLLCLWNLLLSSKRSKRPGPMLTNILAAALLAVLFITINLNQSVLLFVAMLLQACILKFLQARTEKQLKTVIVLSFFSISTVFLYKFDLISTFLVGIFFIGLIAALSSVSGVRSARVSLFKAMQTILIAVPIASMMLIFIPKIPAFWKLPGASSATTGLNERIDPFDIANLAKSGELVFRAEFDNNAPNPPYYWRALLHDEFDGKAWVRSESIYAAASATEVQNYENNATIYLEKSANPWLYTLGYGVSNSPSILNLRHGLIRRKDPSASSFQYPLNFSEQPDLALSEYEYRFYTQLPVTGNPESRKLARQIKSLTSNTQGFIEALYSHYAVNGFTYTLTPTPITGTDTLDIFLTQTQRGFCGHYASVSAFIMRSAGIPARLVSGYLGGEQVTDKNYLAVYQYDAHAWVEYYDGEKWQRFDATSVVAPERLNGSLSQVEELQREFLDNLDFGLIQFANFESLRWLRMKLEELDYSWTKWVLGFDQQQQNNMLKNLLGNKFAQYSMVIVVLCLAIILTVILLISSRQHKTHLSYSAKQLQRLFKAADKLGLLSSEQLTPVNQLHYLARQNPRIESYIEQIKRTYIEQTYKQAEISKNQQTALKRAVNKSIKTLG
ncbi:transglutaminase TgpA family protein [Pseudoalteromonas sp. GB56]